MNPERPKTRLVSFVRRSHAPIVYRTFIHASHDDFAICVMWSKSLIQFRILCGAAHPVCVCVFVYKKNTICENQINLKLRSRWNAQTDTPSEVFITYQQIKLGFNYDSSSELFSLSRFEACANRRTIVPSRRICRTQKRASASLYSPEGWLSFRSKFQIDEHFRTSFSVIKVRFALGWCVGGVRKSELIAKWFPLIRAN